MTISLKWSSVTARSRAATGVGGTLASGGVFRISNAPAELPCEANALTVSVRSFGSADAVDAAYPGFFDVLAALRK